MGGPRARPFLFALLLAALPSRSAQDESFASSFLSGLLDTLDTQVDAKNCPGVCMHVLASLICSNVLDEVECPNPSMKCCVDEPLGNDTLLTTRRPLTTRYTTTESDEEEETTTRAPHHDKYKDSGNYACPGVCVEARLTQYCEAYLTSHDLCVQGRLCCVSKDGYGDKPPSDLVVPNEKKHSTKRPTTALTTTMSTKPKPGRKCRGDCISGLFALLCDHVDEDASCPGEATCCLTEPKSETTTRRPPTTPRPTTPAPLPRCPGYCLLNIMAAFCERPAVLLAHTHCKLSGSICCDNTRFGHIAAACGKKSGKVHKVEETGESSAGPARAAGVEHMMGVYVCADGYAPPIKTDIIIDGAKLVMEIDSGASRTIMSEETFKNLWSTPPPLIPTNLNLVTWAQEPLKVLGMANVRVELGDKEAQCELVVVSGNGPNLLGRNWFHTLGLHVSGLCWSEEQIDQYRKDFPELFKEGLGEYTGPEVTLHLRSDAKPRFMKSPKVPYPLKKKIEEELNKMVESGVLTPVRYSEWATPMTPVMKPDGTVRICGDYRGSVNDAIDTDVYPLPTSMEAFVKLSGGRIFTKLDLKQAYTQLKVDDATAMLLTLNTPIGLMKVNRLPFGVSAAPAIFQRVMSTALAGMEGVACLLDDIAVTGATIEEHNRRLKDVLCKLQEMGLRLNVQKCVFAADSITFLGHMLNAEGLHPSPAKVKEIVDKPARQIKRRLKC